MKKFILLYSILFSFILSLHYIAALCVDGKTDDIYLKISSNRNKSLILGLSRAANGINPEILNKELIGKYDLPIYNFAFNIRESPFGPLYYEAIIRKLDPTAKNGIFILSVNPASISEITAFKEQPDKFRENASGILKLTNKGPNIEYLLKFYNYGWGKIILERMFAKNTGKILHNNGWVEINRSIDKKMVLKKSVETLEFIKKNFSVNHSISKTRVFYLDKTIKLLSKHGKVILVRLPVENPGIREENKMMPDLDKIISELAYRNKAVYLNMSERKNYIFADGQHLTGSSANEFSRELALKINSISAGSL